MPSVIRVLGPEEIDFGETGATALEEGWEEGIILQRFNLHVSNCQL